MARIEILKLKLGLVGCLVIPVAMFLASVLSVVFGILVGVFLAIVGSIIDQSIRCEKCGTSFPWGFLSLGDPTCRNCGCEGQFSYGHVLDVVGRLFGREYGHYGDWRDQIDAIPSGTDCDEEAAAREEGKNKGATQ
jgi:hypothetical protein